MAESGELVRQFLEMVNQGQKSEQNTGVEKVIDLMTSERGDELKRGTLLLAGKMQDAGGVLAAATTDWKAVATKELVFVGNNYPELFERLGDFYGGKLALVEQTGSTELANKSISDVSSELIGLSSQRRFESWDEAVAMAIDSVKEKRNMGEAETGVLRQYMTASINLASYVQTHQNEVYVDENQIMRINFNE